MTAPQLSSSEVRVLFPAGTVLHNPLTGELRSGDAVTVAPGDP